MTSSGRPIRRWPRSPPDALSQPQEVLPDWSVVFIGFDILLSDGRSFSAPFVG